MQRRTVIGFLLAPLTIAIAVYMAAIKDTSILDAAVTAAVWYSYAGIFAIVVAMPAYFILRRFGLVRWWSAVATGSMVGYVVVLTVGENVFLGHVELIFLGAVAGFVFWCVARSDVQPNKTLVR